MTALLVLLTPVPPVAIGLTLVVGLAVAAIVPRLLSIADTALYLGISASTLRALIAAGELVPVRLPSTRLELRQKDEPNRVLRFDAHDLDALVEKWRAASTSTPNVQLSEAAIEGWRRKPHRKTHKVPPAGPKSESAALTHG